jgi:hypothetical protein
MTPWICSNFQNTSQSVQLLKTVTIFISSCGFHVTTPCLVLDTGIMRLFYHDAMTLVGKQLDGYDKTKFAHCKKPRLCFSQRARFKHVLFYSDWSNRWLTKKMKEKKMNCHAVSKSSWNKWALVQILDAHRYFFPYGTSPDILGNGA